MWLAYTEDGYKRWGLNITLSNRKGQKSSKSLIVSRDLDRESVTDLPDDPEQTNRIVRPYVYNINSDSMQS